MCASYKQGTSHGSWHLILTEPHEIDTMTLDVQRVKLRLESLSNLPTL